MQTALVAGGAGFIGSHLCKRLLRDGYKVICVDNLITGGKGNIEELLNNREFQFVEEDIAQKSSKWTGRFACKVQSSKLDYIFHLASPASPNKKSKKSYINYPIETLLVNSSGTYGLLELAKDMSARFLYASSSEVYGDPAVSPQNEEYFGNVNPNGVRSVYDEGKRFGEAITMVYVRKNNLDARIVRIFNTYGPGMQKDDGRVVSNFINQVLCREPITIYGNGTQTRSFCYIDDMVEGITKAMFTEELRGQVINLGNPDERKILELATMVKEIAGSRSKIIHEELPQDDPKRRKPDIAKARQLLGWSPKVDLQEGLRITVKYFKSL